jgi:hypothetical protein
MSNYYTPIYKWELVNFIRQYYSKENQKKFERMPKKQLYAIFYKIREKYDNTKRY